MKTTVRLLVFLGIISALSGLSLGFVNQLVEPVIEENNRRAEEESLRSIFAEGTFDPVAYTDPNGIIQEIYHVEGSGYVIKTKGTGFNTSVPIVLLVGFDENGTTIAIRVLEQQETNGFGSKNFLEENIEKLYLNRSIDENVDLLSGATFTSKAMEQMISAAQAALKEVK